MKNNSLEDFLIDVEDKSSLDPISFQYFDNLKNHRTIIYNSEISENIIEQLYIPLKRYELDDDDTPITLYFHCIGGSVGDALFLTDYFKIFSKRLNIIILGYCCSMATVLVAACHLNPNISVSAYPNTYFLIHDGNIALSAQEAKTAADIMAFNDICDNRIKNIFVENTNITSDFYDSKSRHQYFFFAEEAKKLGIIDKIIN